MRSDHLSPKVTAIPIVLGLLVVIAVCSGRERRTSEALRVAVSAGLCCGWWFVRNMLRYGDLFATKVANRNMTEILGPNLLPTLPECRSAC